MRRIIKKIISEQHEPQPEFNDKEWVKIEPDRYLDLLKFASYNSKGISNLPIYRGKKIWITGDLDVSNLPISSLDGIYYVDGTLSIARTEIGDVSNLKVRKNIWDSGSKREKIRFAKIKRQKQEVLQSYREAKNRDLSKDLGPTGLKANALIQYFENYYPQLVMDEDDESLKIELINKIEDLVKKEKEYEENGRDTGDVISDIEVAQEELDELEKKMDVYDLYQYGGRKDGVGMITFEIISNNDLNGREYMVGTDDEAREACEEYIKENLTNFNKDFIERHIDEDSVVEYFSDYYSQDIWDNPDSYFSKDDYQLTDEQENEIELYQSQIEELERKQNNLEQEIEEPSEYSKAWDDIQSQIDDLEEKINEIEPDDSVTQEMVDDKLEEYLRDVRRNPKSYLDQFYLDINNFINEDSLIEDAIDSDGYGYFLGTYDGSYDTETILDVDYIICRVN